MAKDDKIINELKALALKVDALQDSVNELNSKLSKHIEFIDETYRGLKNPIDAAKRFLGR